MSAPWAIKGPNAGPGGSEPSERGRSQLDADVTRVDGVRIVTDAAAVTGIEVGADSDVCAAATAARPRWPGGLVSGRSIDAGASGEWSARRTTSIGVDAARPLRCSKAMSAPWAIKGPNASPVDSEPNARGGSIPDASATRVDGVRMATGADVGAITGADVGAITGIEVGADSGVCAAATAAAGDGAATCRGPAVGGALAGVAAEAGTPTTAAAEAEAETADSAAGGVADAGRSAARRTTSGRSEGPGSGVVERGTRTLAKG